jgi:type I restriction enzyme S subunit
MTGAGGLKRISPGAILDHRLLITDIRQQRQIVSYLDRETRRIDDLIAEKGSFITLLRGKRVAEISHAVTKGINSDGPKKPSGVAWIGDIPASWDLTKLGYLGRSANGVNIGGDAFGTGFPFVSYGDVYKNRQLPETVKGLVECSKQDRRTYSVREGDIFFTRTSETSDEIAFPSVCKKSIPEAVFAGFLIRFRPYPGVLLPGFSKYAFQNQAVRHFFSREMKLVTRASLSQGLLQSLPLPLPPIDVQQSIAEYLDRKEVRFLELVSETERSIALLKEKRAALITAAVTGKIDVRSSA